MAYNLRRLFLEIRSCLSSNPGLRLDQLQSHLGIERHTIERAVLEATAASFRAYQKRNRLETALALLTHAGKLSGKQIAAELGYKSSAAFSRFIKTATGETPTQIRQKGGRRQFIKRDN